MTKTLLFDKQWCDGKEIRRTFCIGLFIVKNNTT